MDRGGWMGQHVVDADFVAHLISRYRAATAYLFLDGYWAWLRIVSPAPTGFFFAPR